MVGRSSELITELRKIDHDKIDQIVLEILAAKRVYICGNGGSALNAQHFESDLQSLKIDATCLDNNAARITAITNDFGWENLYTIQLFNVKPGDLLIIFTVHGSTGKMYGDKWSQNLAKATILAKNSGAKVVVISGNLGGSIAELADYALICLSGDVDVVEPFHSALCHDICARIKDAGAKLDNSNN